MYTYCGPQSVYTKKKHAKKTNKQTKSNKTDSENTMLTAYTAKSTVKNSIR